MDAIKDMTPADGTYIARQQKVRDAMAAKGIDAIAVCGADFHNYLAGLWGIPNGRAVWLVLSQNGPPAFVAPRSEAVEIRARCKVPVALEWVEWEKPDPAPMTHQDALAQHIRTIAPNARKIGIDFNNASAENVELIKGVLADMEIVNVAPLLKQEWAAKDALALQGIRSAIEVGTAQYRAAVEAIAPGVAEWQVTLATVTGAIQKSAELLGDDDEQPRFWPHQMNMIGSGADRSSRCHGSGGGRVMQDGELVQICLCGQVFLGHGICFDRPIAVGSKALSPSQREIIDAVRQAQDAAIAVMRPGVTGDEVHTAAVKKIEESGFAGCLLHRTGRSLGYGDGDGRALMAGSLTPLEEGEVYSVEPGIYVPGVGGARFGDMVRVVAEGHEVLTDYTLGRNL